MADDLVEALNPIITTAHQMLDEATLNELQRKFLYAIAQEAQQLQTLLVTVVDTQDSMARELLNFEARSHLTSIIGYAEVLLDEIEGNLKPMQRDAIHVVRSSGKQLLSRLEKLSN